MKHSKYTKEQIFEQNPQKVYQGKYLNEICFPLGGIGTGSIGLTGSGRLRDFEIFNKPNVGSKYPKTFAAIRTKTASENPVCRILEGPVQRPYTPHDGGIFHANGEGYPHMDSCEFRGEYPFAWIDFKSSSLPIKVQLEAYNPFIPSDADASGIPCAILKYKVTNVSEQPVETSIFWSLYNMVGILPEEYLKLSNNAGYYPKGKFEIIYKESDALKGIFFKNDQWKETDTNFGSIALTSPDEDISYLRYWKQGPWFTSHNYIWDSFKATGRLTEVGKPHLDQGDAGALAITKMIPPHQTEYFTFYITWYFPNFEKYWQLVSPHGKNDLNPTWQNYYAHFFKNAFDVAIKMHAQEENYYHLSKLFHDTLFSSTLPSYIIDAIASNIAILKTPTCLRLNDGTFYGWEGCHPSAGCCEGSCTHVWGYQQALPFLFPQLERSMHDANYKYNFMFDDIGMLRFRLELPLGKEGGFPKPCADGQFGGIMHVYRDWKISGDDHWLINLWPHVKMALQFAWEDWDEEKTGVLRGFQHNTYDIDFHGPNPMLTCYYLGALKAGAEMAFYIGEKDSAQEYLEIYEKGRKWVDAHLFNGEYYIQKHDPNVAKEWQCGLGCLIDQLVGLELALIAGIENFLDKNNVKQTLHSIFKYNWKSNMRDHENGSRLYAVNDESATIICTWPHGKRPEIPFPYADEVMNGFEYQFGVHCIYEGLIEEGLIAAKSVRDRYDGWGRNPWDEFECGHHYARSMASYGYLIALSGFEYHKGKGYLGFHPVINKEKFQCFWSLDNVWGQYLQDTEMCVIVVLYGEISLKNIKIGQFNNQSFSVEISDQSYSVVADSSGIIDLPIKITIKKHEKITIKLT